MADHIELESLGNGRFLVSGALSFATAQQALDEGERLFAPFSDINLDMAQVEKGDSAGLAVLIEWISYASKQEKTIHFIHLPNQLHALAVISEAEDLLPVSG